MSWPGQGCSCSWGDYRNQGSRNSPEQHGSRAREQSNPHGQQGNLTAMRSSSSEQLTGIKTHICNTSQPLAGLRRENALDGWPARTRIIAIESLMHVHTV